jgi:hypothetical protein
MASFTTTKINKANQQEGLKIFQLSTFIATFSKLDCTALLPNKTNRKNEFRLNNITLWW